MARGRPANVPKSETTSEPASAAAVAEALAEPMPKPKRCPRCQGEAGSFLDKNKLWRCACKSCGWWDSIVKYTEREAIASYNASGGPAAVSDSL